MTSPIKVMKLRKASINSLPLCLAVLTTMLALPAQAANLYIEALQTTLTPEADGSIVVEERYQYDPWRLSPKGINHLRQFDLTPPEPARSPLRWRYIELTEVTVHEGGTAIPAEIQRRGSMTAISWPISTTTPYTLRYRLRGALSYPSPTEAELVWSAAGVHGDTYIRNVVVQINGDEAVLGTGRSCVVARPEQLDSCGGLTTDTAGARFTAERIEPGAEVVVTQILDPATVAYAPVESIRAVTWLGGALASLSRSSSSGSPHSARGGNSQRQMRNPPSKAKT